MVDKTTHDDYIRVYKDFVDTINHKEDIIHAMTIYIARNSKKINDICKYKEKGLKCNYINCEKCIRNYFEEIEYGRLQEK